MRYKPLSVRVAVTAIEPGIDGNVDAGTLVLMPTPPRNVDSVTNEDRTQGGQQAEDDDRLRERAKHALERAGNATINAIRFAVLQVEGVQGVEVFDHQRDGDIQLGELRVCYAGPESDELHDAVVAAVDRTRAAGVMARVERITPVTLSGRFVLVPAETPDAGAEAAFVAAAWAVIDALAIGQPLALRRLQALAFQLPGLADMAEAQLLQHQPLPSSPGTPVTGDTLIVGGQQMVRADPTELSALTLAKVVAASHQKLGHGQYRVTLQLHDGSGQPVAFGNFALDIAVAARAALQSNPTEQPVRVGAFTRKVTFSAGDSAALHIAVATDLPGFGPAEHVHEVQFSFAAGAYPGLKAAARGVDVVA
ncbi:MAG TPA: baseplate J/gp47 family protein [Burkholderiaceae bacterium]|nr:baseplate J/gp47 family protein [Burkholderiaceae bacterium]